MAYPPPTSFLTAGATNDPRFNPEIFARMMEHVSQPTVELSEAKLREFVVKYAQQYVAYAKITMKSEAAFIKAAELEESIKKTEAILPSLTNALVEIMEKEGNNPSATNAQFEIIKETKVFLTNLKAEHASLQLLDNDRAELNNKKHQVETLGRVIAAIQQRTRSLIRDEIIAGYEATGTFEENVLEKFHQSDQASNSNPPTDGSPRFKYPLFGSRNEHEATSDVPYISTSPKKTSLQATKTSASFAYTPGISLSPSSPVAQHSQVNEAAASKKRARNEVVDSNEQGEEGNQRKKRVTKAAKTAALSDHDDDDASVKSEKSKVDYRGIKKRKERVALWYKLGLNFKHGGDPPAGWQEGYNVPEGWISGTDLPKGHEFFPGMPAWTFYPESHPEVIENRNNVPTAAEHYAMNPVERPADFYPGQDLSAPTRFAKDPVSGKWKPINESTDRPRSIPNNGALVYTPNQASSAYVSPYSSTPQASPVRTAATFAVLPQTPTNSISAATPAPTSAPNTLKTIDQLSDRHITACPPTTPVKSSVATEAVIDLTEVIDPSVEVKAAIPMAKSPTGTRSIRSYFTVGQKGPITPVSSEAQNISQSVESLLAADDSLFIEDTSSQDTPEQVASGETNDLSSHGNQNPSLRATNPSTTNVADPSFDSWEADIYLRMMNAMNSDNMYQDVNMASAAPLDSTSSEIDPIISSYDAYGNEIFDFQSTLDNKNNANTSMNLQLGGDENFDDLCNWDQ